MRNGFRSMMSTLFSMRKLISNIFYCTITFNLTLLMFTCQRQTRPFLSSPWIKSFDFQTFFDLFRNCPAQNQTRKYFSTPFIHTLSQGEQIFPDPLSYRFYGRYSYSHLCSRPKLWTVIHRSPVYISRVHVQKHRKMTVLLQNITECFLLFFHPGDNCG